MKRITTLLCLGFLLFIGVVPRQVRADTPDISCGQSAQSQVSALVKIPAPNPEIYVRASLLEDQGPAHLYFQFLTDGEGPCVDLGPVTLTANWQKVTTTPLEVVEKIGILTLTLPDLAPSSGASTPQALFTPITPPCLLGGGCEITYGGSQFELAPKKVSSSGDTLHTGVLSSPAADTIKQVIYSVDGVQVYTKKALLPFNESYVAGGEHSIERTIVLSSGQSLSDKRIVKKGNIASVNYLAISIFHRYLKLVVFFGGLIWLLIIWLLFVWFARFLYKRKVWRNEHIASRRSGFDPSKAGPQPEGKFNDSPVDIIKNHKKAFFIPFSGLVALFLVYSFVLSTFKVDGISMYPTLQDKSTRPLFILPAALGKVTGNGYTPTRGTIVVIQKDENNLFDESALQQKSFVVKRVVGLPEERVVVKSGVVTVFNKQYPNGFVPDNTFKWLKNPPQNEYTRLDVTLKQGELFVMGDNRDNSIDSRFYGPIKTTEVVGKVL